MDFRPYQSKSIRIEIHTMNFKYDILYKGKVLSTLKRNIIHTNSVGNLETKLIDHTGNLESKSIVESLVGTTNHTGHQDK